VYRTDDWQAALRHVVRPGQVEAGQRGAVGHAELRERTVQVVADRSGADEQLGGDVPVGRAGSGEPNDLEFLRV
jgi:hypothetical protein